MQMVDDVDEQGSEGADLEVRRSNGGADGVVHEEATRQRAIGRRGLPRGPAYGTVRASYPTSHETGKRTP